MLKTILIFFFGLLISCNRSDFHLTINMNWKIISENNGIQLYKGYNPDVPLRGWSVIIPNKKDNKITILVASGDDGLDTPSDFALKNGANVLVNGGYFTRGQSPVSHVGLLKSNNVLIEPASKTVFREKIRYDVNRGAFGIFENGQVDIGWASTRNDSIFVWDRPVKNRPGKPDILDYNKGKFWDVVEAIHAGPILINNGKINVTSEEEVFFNTPVDGVQPRSAIGYTINGDIVIMVIDGRQVDSRGAYLEELAMLMLQFQCYEALNLDGGGSSALIFYDKLINKPIGLINQREIMSSIGVISKN